MCAVLSLVISHDYRSVTWKLTVPSPTMVFGLLPALRVEWAYVSVPVIAPFANAPENVTRSIAVTGAAPGLVNVVWLVHERFDGPPVMAHSCPRPTD